MSWREWWFQITNDMFWPVVAVWIMIMTIPRVRKKEDEDGDIHPTGLPILVYDREEALQRTDNSEASGSDLDGDERIFDRPTSRLAEYPPIAPEPDPIPGASEAD